MRYETVQLALGLEEAHERITERVSDCRARTTDGRIEYRTNAGLLLAVLTETDGTDGAAGSELRYRSVMISPQMRHARTLADQIRRAVEDDRIE